MKEELPSQLPEHLKRKIRSGLLRVHSKWIATEDSDSALNEAYNVYAAEISHSGKPLDESLVRQEIPAWVFKWAVSRKWWGYPPQRLAQRKSEPFSGKYRSSHEPVPEAELKEEFGGYKVTASYKERFLRKLESRIVYWEATSLMHPAAASEHNHVANSTSSQREHAPSLSDIEAALNTNNRKKAVQLRRQLEPGTITRLWDEAFRARKGTHKTKRTAFNRWQASRPDTPSWADPLMRTRLLK